MAPQQLNFKNCKSLAEAEFLAGFDGLITAEKRRRQKQLQCCLAISQMDERAMEVWAPAFSQDVLDERVFYAQKKAECRAEKEGIHVRKRFIEAQEAGQPVDDRRQRRPLDGYVLERAVRVVGIGLRLPIRCFYCICLIVVLVIVLLNLF
jgi:hypothetical protein